MITVFTLLLLVWIVGGIAASFLYLPLLPAIGAAVVGVPFGAWLAVTLYGLWRRAQGQIPFDAAAQERDAARLGGEGHHVKMDDGRIVEYLVYGSKRPDAKVVVHIHGAGMSAGAYCQMYASLCEELNVKGIAPSMPGYGYSDIRPGRLIVDFPLDVDAILKAEGVGEFMVEGLSLGTAHAMAVAWHFGPDRCVAMGLNAPYVGEQICREYDLKNDADMLPKTDARAWYQAWNFFVADLMWSAPLLSPPGRHMPKLAGGKKVATERPWIFKMFEEDGARVVVRGTQGQAWDQFSHEMNTLWGFDPLEIVTRNVAVWWARDDVPAPPEHGEWLANYFSAKEGIKTDVRDEDAGFSHFTYCPSLGPGYQSGERTLTKTMYDLCAQEGR